MYFYRRVQIASRVRFPDSRHAMSAQAKYASGIGGWGNSQTQCGAGKRRHGHIAAENRRRDGDRDTRVEILSAAFESRMRLDVHDQIQIAGRSARWSSFALAARANPHPILDTGRNSNVDGSRVSVIANRHAPGRSGKRLLERQIDWLLEIAPASRSLLASP